MLGSMTKAFRPYDQWYTTLPLEPNVTPIIFTEAMSDKIAWMRLRQLADVPSRGLALFAGTRPERNRLYKHFRSYVRQAQTYWNAAGNTEGSASTLLYYYAVLNLAKAELLQTNPNEIIGKSIHHGLSAKLSEPMSLRGDRLTAPRGLFPLLFEKRTGMALPPRIQFPVVNILSLIPEIGHEMSEFGATRPPSRGGFHAVAIDKASAWATTALPLNLTVDRREPVVRKLLSEFEPVQGDRAWRKLFGVSTRLSSGLTILQSKRTYSVGSPARPNPNEAQHVFRDTVGRFLSSPHDARAEYTLTYSLRKSDPFFVPLPLARYMAVFYMSSVVRYKPASIDPIREGEQAWLADSFARETPSLLLADSVEAITSSPSYFEPNQYRS